MTLILRTIRAAALGAGILAGAWISAGAASAGEIKIGGTGNALGAARLLAQAFMQKETAITVKVLPSVGTSGAIKAVPRGALDIGFSSRELNDEEKAAGLAAVEYARTPTVFAVRTNTQTRAVTRSQIADIYSGKLPTWPDGSPIRPVLRQPGDDNTRQLRGLSAEIATALDVASKRSGLPYAVTDQEAADKIEQIPGAIGTTTLGLIRSEGRNLTPLNLDNIEPTVANIASGQYPLVKRFFAITRNNPSTEVQRFLVFLKSPAAQEILSRTGHLIP